MNKIAEYSYPVLGTFQEAVTITEKAINNFGGIIPMEEAAKILGYRIHEKSRLSGTVYQRIKDLESFGLFHKERGGLRITETARDALHPSNEEAVALGTMKAIRNITIIGKAFDEWKGLVPEISAFPGKLSDLLGISWTDCKKHSIPLKKLFTETFPYLGDFKQPYDIIDEISFPKIQADQRMDEKKPSILRGELKTTIGSVYITDESTLNLARNLLDVFGKKLNEAKSGSTVK